VQDPSFRQPHNRVPGPANPDAHSIRPRESKHAPHHLQASYRFRNTTKPDSGVGREGDRDSVLRRPTRAGGSGILKQRQQVTGLGEHFATEHVLKDQLHLELAIPSTLNCRCRRSMLQPRRSRLSWSWWDPGLKLEEAAEGWKSTRG
jgi:hypothetical protein